MVTSLPRAPPLEATLRPAMGSGSLTGTRVAMGSRSNHSLPGEPSRDGYHGVLGPPAGLGPGVAAGQRACGFLSCSRHSAWRTPPSRNESLSDPIAVPA